MAMIARPNRDALNKAIDIYRDAMRPFLLRCLKQVPRATVEEAIKRSLPDRQADEFIRKRQRGDDLASALDVNMFPELVQRNWNSAFASELSRNRSMQSEVWLITSARNAVAHPGAHDLEEEFTRARLFDIATVLGRINAQEEKRAVEKIKDDLAARPEPRPEPESNPRSGARAASNLKAWRDAIRPNPDVAQGSYQQAEFAADLQQVYDGRADATQYGNPVSFYEHTYITPGIRTLLVNTLKRLAGRGGDPVIQTKTGFGGGKTHSLIALYHLVRSGDALINHQAGDASPVSGEIRAIMDEAGYERAGDPPQVAVLDGTFLAPTDAAVTRDAGDPLNTLWGVMAYQLGGQEGYDIIGDAARGGVAPGGRQLDRLFNFVGPCVILVDELVAYARNAGAAQDNLYTFVQALTQSARRSANVALVLTLPESRAEAGAEGGIAALDRLERLLGRIEAVWEPLAVNETFEVVRRRLFGELADPAARDETCEAFVRMYSKSRANYPRGVSEQNYLKRMKECYPIHPEIFDRLYLDWSSMPGFQRTRGVLRMMASCVNRLYLNNDSSPLILPADLPLGDEALANEFLRLLSGSWRPVLSEVDSDYSRADNLDTASSRFAKVGGAARRTARVIFLGSAPSGAVQGIDAGQIRLGAALPGDGIQIYNDALRSLENNLYYLYHSDQRYFFHAEENLNKVSHDRFNAQQNSVVDEHIVKRLDEARNRRGDVLLYAGDTEGVPDVDWVRLVALPPAMALPSRSKESDEAARAALEILQHRGDASRFRRNTLLFLAAKQDEIRALRNEVRNFLAWDSIINGATQIQNLTGNRLRQAKAAVKDADSKVISALARAYRWALAPVQLDPQQAEYRLSPAQTDGPNSGEIFQAAFDMFVQDEALINAISPKSLATTLENYIWNREDSPAHLDIDTLWDLLTGNVYMPRLRDRTALVICIRQGVEEGEWGYAEDYDEERSMYDGLRYRESMTGADLMVRDLPSGLPSGLLVRPEVAGQGDVISPDSLNTILEEHVWNREDCAKHLDIDDLWGRMTAGHIDMPRLRDRATLENCIRQGVEEKKWGYAKNYDGEKYDGLRYGEPMTDADSIVIEGPPGLLVHPKAAQIIVDPPPPIGPCRIVVRKTTGPDISLDEISQLRDEIIRNLKSDGGEITVEIIVSARKEKGFSEGIARSARDNSEELGLEFSEESKIAPT